MGRAPIGGKAAGRARLAGAMAALMLAAGPSPAPAQDSDPGRQLGAVEAELEAARARQAALGEEAQRIAEELAGLRRAMVAAAEAIARAQGNVEQLEAEAAALVEEEQRQSAALLLRSADLDILIRALVQLARVPREAMVARPEAPLRIVRSAMLLRTTVPAIEAEAATLRRAIDELAAVRAELSQRQAEALAARRGLDEELERLDGLVDRRSLLLAVTTEEQRRTAAEAEQLAAEALDLRDLLRRIEEERAPVEVAAGIPLPVGATVGQQTAMVAPVAPEAAPLATFSGVILPASGEVVLSFGELDRFGQPSPGITVRAHAGQPVVAPMDGGVRFAGAFRGYGDILILEHPGGYHSLIAGFGRIDAVVGQEVLAGEPVGVTPLPQTGASERPVLYFEFRRDGRPVNPVQGLARAQERG